MLLLTERSKMTEIHEMLGKNAIADPWNSGPLTYQQMSFGPGHTTTILATAPDLFKRIKALQNAYNLKGKAERQVPFASMQFIKHDTKVWNTYLHYRTTTANVKDTDKYLPCIPGADWLKAHINDPYPEPTIDITIDGGPTLNVNGNYKAGMIRQFMLANKGG